MRSVTVFCYMCKGGRRWGTCSPRYVKPNPLSPCSREEHKNYIPPGGWSPKIFDGGPIPIKQVLLQCSKNRGGWGV